MKASWKWDNKVKSPREREKLQSEWETVWTEKNRQMSIKIAQKWYHYVEKW